MLPGIAKPAALVWPPPPNLRANAATSTAPTDRSETFTRPWETSRKSNAMHTKIRMSTAKKAKKTGFLTRQRTAGGRKVNRRQRRRHGSF